MCCYNVFRREPDASRGVVRGKSACGNLVISFAKAKAKKSLEKAQR
jgi:hypothetical protein